MRIPALTLWQPWAGAIINDIKTIENRSWSAYNKLIGQRVAIHAGKTFDEAAWLEDERIVRFCHDLGAPRKSYDRYFTDSAVLGTALFVGEVYLADGKVVTHGGPVRWLTESDLLWWERDQIGMIFRKPIAFPSPVPARGHQGIWYWDVPEQFGLHVPSQACRVCGCTNARACPRGCWWVEPDLCSECYDRSDTNLLGAPTSPSASAAQPGAAVPHSEPPTPDPQPLTPESRGSS